MPYYDVHLQIPQKQEISHYTLPERFDSESALKNLINTGWWRAVSTSGVPL